jgi:hypothetical protein
MLELVIKKGQLSRGVINSNVPSHMDIYIPTAYGSQFKTGPCFSLVCNSDTGEYLSPTRASVGFP